MLSALSVLLVVLLIIWHQKARKVTWGCRGDDEIRGCFFLGGVGGDVFVKHPPTWTLSE